MWIMTVTAFVTMQVHVMEKAAAVGEDSGLIIQPAMHPGRVLIM
jgi:hypothetical protein